MDGAFAETVEDWSGFFAFTGGAAATLLGLLFVSVSLRLDIFRRREIADVRDFAALTFASYLVALAVAGLSLAPHQRWQTLALPLALLGLTGLAAFALFVREWRRLNPSSPAPRPGLDPGRPQGWLFIIGVAAPYAGLVVVAGLLWENRAEALAGLAIVQGALLAFATMNAWLMLSRAGASADTVPADPGVLTASDGRGPAAGVGASTGLTPEDGGK
jgi:hypothetical protein